MYSADGGHPSRIRGGRGIACGNQLLLLKLELLELIIMLLTLLKDIRGGRDQAKQAGPERTNLKRRGFVIKPCRFRSPRGSPLGNYPRREAETVNIKRIRQRKSWLEYSPFSRCNPAVREQMGRLCRQWRFRRQVRRCVSVRDGSAVSNFQPPGAAVRKLVAREGEQQPESGAVRRSHKGRRGSNVRGTSREETQ